MRSDLTIGLHSPGDVAAVLEEWTKKRELKEDLFDSHPSLQAAHRDFRAFLVSTHTTVAPAIRTLNIPILVSDPQEFPELAIAGAFLAAIAEIGKNRVVLDWYQQHDIKCRNAYKRIFPLLKRAALGTAWNDRSIHVRHWFTREHGVFLEALNQSGRSLHNVSLRVVFETLDGRPCEHYYFREAWDAEDAGKDSHRFFLRPAADWWSIGADAVTRATVDLYSDEIIVERVRSDLDDQVPTAADRIMAEIDVQLRSQLHPKLALNRLELIRPQLAAYPDRVARVDAQHKLAKDMLGNALAAIDKRIKSAKDKIEELERPPPKGRSTSGREEQIRRERKIVQDLEGQRMRWVKGEELPTDRQPSKPFQPPR